MPDQKSVIADPGGASLERMFSAIAPRYDLLNRVLSAVMRDAASLFSL